MIDETTADETTADDDAFIRGEWSLHVYFPTLAELRRIGEDDSGDTMCDRDRFIIELVERVQSLNHRVGAEVWTVQRVLSSRDIHFCEVSFDSFEFISSLARWVMHVTSFTSLRVQRHPPRKS